MSDKDWSQSKIVKKGQVGAISSMKEWAYDGTHEVNSHSLLGEVEVNSYYFVCLKRGTILDFSTSL